MLYFCMLLYITLVYIRPAEIVPEWGLIPFVDILTVITAIIAVFSIAAKPRSFLNLPLDKLLLVFWGLIFVCTIKVWLSGAIDAWLAFMPTVVCYFLIRAGITSQKQLYGFVYLLLGLNIFLAINGIVQYHTGVGFGNVTMVLDRIYGTGIFHDPNDLGMTFVMAIPLFMFFLSRSSTPVLLRLPLVVGLGCVLVALYYTNSRGSIVGVGAAMVSISFLKYRRFAATFAAAVLLGVIVVAAPSRGGEISAGESSAQSRIQSWAEGWAMLKSYPLTGVGFEQYTEYHIKVAHNSFVNTFAELGLLGAFCFVGMFYWFFKGIRLIPKEDNDWAAWRRALLASSVGVMTCGWFLSRQYVPIFYVMLAMGACTTTIAAGQESTAKLRTTGNDLVMIGVTTIALLLLVYFSIRTLAIWSG